MRFACVLVVTTVLFAGLAVSQDRKGPHVAATDPRSPAEELKRLRVPDGYEVQLVAAEPEIAKPMNLAFDDQGRLWVTESVEYPFPAAAGKKPRDAVKVLDDLGDDGRARKVTTFADGLNIPIGLLPFGREAMVHSIPNVYRLRDTDGDGRADERAVLYGGYGSADTHGMTSAFTWGFDGWVYACHGFANNSAVKDEAGNEVRMNSGNVYRVRPDGSRVEQVTWGQVNPFGLSLDPLGNLYSADCHTQPIYQLLRGAYYPSFGKPHDGLGFGPEMLTNFKGSTAISGIVYYAADHFPADARGTAFVGDVVTNEIVQFRLSWDGSTPRATAHKFLQSDDPWFRPVDIKLGPDGALYVADFYNRIIGHYEVPLTHPGRDRERGRIWRIVYRGERLLPSPRPPRADWARASAAELANDLANPNLVVRLKATHQLVGREGRDVEEAVRAVMRPGADAWQRMHGPWVLERRGVLDDETLTAAAKDREPGVRVHAQRVLSERGRLTESQRKRAVAALGDKDAHVRRAAADALGRHPDSENVRPLLDLRRSVPAGDTHLLHVVRMALRDQLRPAETWSKLAGQEWSEVDARALADVAPGVPSAEAAAYLLAHLRRYPETGERLAAYVHHVARRGAGDPTKALLAFVRGDRTDDLRHQVALLRALDRGTQERGAAPGDDVKAWAADVCGRLLTGPDPVAGAELAGSMKLSAVRDKLDAQATSRQAPEPHRVAAFNALAALDAAGPVPLLGRVLLDAGEAVTMREQAANVLVRVNRPDALALLAQALPVAPARLQTVVAAGLAGSPAGAEKLLEAVAAGKASARLLQERAVEVRLAGSRLPNVRERVAKLTQGLPPADRSLQNLAEVRRRGFAAAKTDATAGARVFEKHCANCHQVGGKGAKVGPQLDGIGARGVERLLEDVLDPNRNVDQAFRTTTFNLKNGQVASGLLLREEGEVLVLADAQGKEVRVAAKEVEEKTVTPLSPMPANLVDQIEEIDLYHLLAYLLAQRPNSGDKR